MNNKRITGTGRKTAFSLASIYVRDILFDTTFFFLIKFQEIDYYSFAYPSHLHYTKSEHKNSRYLL